MAAAIPGGWWLLAGVMALSWYAGGVQRDSLLAQLEVEGRQQLDLYVSHFAGQLDEFAFLPALLADDHRLMRCCSRRGTPPCGTR